jgi:hypothetical protein
MGNCCSNHKDIVYPAKFQPIPTNPPPEDVIDEFVKVNRAQANDEVVELDSKKLVDKQKFDKKHQNKFKVIDDSNMSSKFLISTFFHFDQGGLKFSFS